MMNRTQKELIEKLSNLSLTNPVAFAELKGRIDATYEMLALPDKQKKLTKV